MQAETETGKKTMHPGARPAGHPVPVGYLRIDRHDRRAALALPLAGCEPTAECPARLAAAVLPPLTSSKTPQRGRCKTGWRREGCHHNA